MPFRAAQALVNLPATLRHLHLLPPFPKTFNYVTAHKFFIWELRTAGLLPQSEIEEVFYGYERSCAVCPRLDADLVSCHMDLKRENILFDVIHALRDRSLSRGVAALCIGGRNSIALAVERP